MILQPNGGPNYGDDKAEAKQSFLDSQILSDTVSTVPTGAGDQPSKHNTVVEVWGSMTPDKSKKKKNSTEQLPKSKKQKKEAKSKESSSPTTSSKASTSMSTVSTGASAGASLVKKVGRFQGPIKA